MRLLIILGFSFLTSTLTCAQVTIFYDDNCNITMRDLATHYRIARVDTVLKKFIGEVKDFWGNDTLMTSLTYDLNGNRDGLIKVKSSDGSIRLTGQYSSGQRSGIWEFSQVKPALIDFNRKQVKSNQTLANVEGCLARKENFSISNYIRKSDYPDLYPLITTSSQYMRTMVGAFTIVEEPPYFPNGMKALGQFISAYMKYPDEALKNNIKGQVIIEFTITESGSMTDFKVVRSLGHGCDEEAVRVLKLLPDWVPGYQRGRAVRTKFTLPITFG